MILLGILFLVLFRIMQYPVTVASFQKFKLEKTRYMTYSEEHESSWCFKNLTNSKAMVDIFQNPRDPVSPQNNGSFI